MASRRVRTMEVRFWSKVDKNGPTKEGPMYEGLGPCWLYKGDGTIAFDRAHLIEDGPKKISVSRYSWILHNGPIEDYLVVRHRCDNGHLRCVNPQHLEIGTQGDNVQDCHDRQRVVPRSVREDMKIPIAKAARDYGITSAELAAIVGVHEETIAKVIRETPLEGIPVKRRLRVTPSDKELFRKLQTEGLCISEIARRTGRSFSTVSAALGAL